MNFLGLLKIVAFSLGVALLKLPDIVSHKHFEATVSIVCPIAAISSVITGPYLDYSKMLRSASGDSDVVRHLVRSSLGSTLGCSFFLGLATMFHFAGSKGKKATVLQVKGENDS